MLYRRGRISVVTLNHSIIKVINVVRIEFFTAVNVNGTIS